MSAFLQLAPMQAMTDIFFMNTFHDLFGGFTEMMPPYIQASAKSPIKSQTLKRIFRYANPDITIVPQLLSNDAEGFVHVANSLYELGYKKINWNLGCPYPVVTKKMRGAGLIPHPDVINNILDKLDTELLPKLSVKIRLGLNHENELFDLVNVFNQHKIAEIIIHPRTADQKYEGEPKLSVFEEIYTQFNAPVIYNGNIVFFRRL